MAGFIAPMKAVSADLPTGDGWAFEVKWDGMRVEAGVSAAGEVVAWNGRGVPVTNRFPELAELAGAVGGRAVVVDGEAVVLDEAGRSSFSRLQHRMLVEDPGRVSGLLREHPVAYVAFDLLHLDGHDLVDLPYRDRRQLLLDLAEPGGRILVPDHSVGHGPELYAAAAEGGLEGLMAKRLDSPYQPGKRSPSWRKCKVRRRQEVVVGGWLSGDGRRADTVGSLLVGVHEPSRPGNPLVFAGGVGTGFTDQVLEDLRRRLVALRTDRCPFDEPPAAPRGRIASWVDPVLVAEVEFGEWTPDGSLRHPAYLGLRTDKDPATVIREPEGSAGRWR